MKGSNYDVIIVGARCAGATLAIYLARTGASVLLLDRDRLPSDQVLSTHTIHPPGIDVLDEVGIGDAMREVTPPSYILRVNKDGAMVDVQFSDGRAEYCPRRKRLDGLLQDAAIAAGAELLDQTRVMSLIEENGRISGVHAVSGNEERKFRAGMVVGADGRHSTIASLVGAEEYLAYDAPRAMYWGYWDAPDFWKTSPEYRFGMYVGKTGRDIRLVVQTDNDQLLMGALPLAEDIKTWRADPRKALYSFLVSDPMTGPLIEGKEPDGKIRGTVKERYFFRRGAGPGWALVGDAGHHKEFVIGDGITEAFLQARSLATAIAEGTNEALIRYWRARDVEALPLYFHGQNEGAADPPTELQRLVILQATRDPVLKKKFALMLEHKVSPFEIISPTSALRLALGAALRGKSHVLAEFMAMGKRSAQVNHELRYRKQLLAEVMSEG